MEKKFDPVEVMFYYRLIPLAAAAALLLILHKHIVGCLMLAFGYSEGSILYTLLSVVFNLLMAVVWFFVSYITIRRRRYLYITGRKLIWDIITYRRSIWRLTNYFKDADPHRLDTSDFAPINWKRANGFIFGKDGSNRLISIPENCESNIAVFGPPGTGKTSGIAIINALRFGGAILAIDIKGDIFNFCRGKRPIVRFCPDEPNALSESVHFNPFAGIDRMTTTDKKLYIDNMAIVLVPDEGGSDSSYFTSRARKFFSGIIHLMLYDNPYVTFPEVVHTILRGNPFAWVEKAMKSDCVEAAELLSSFYGNNEKNISGAYDNLCTALSPFSNPVLDELLTDNGNCISIGTLENGTSVFLQISQEHLDVYAPLFTLIIESFSTAFTRRPDTSTGAKNLPILMLIDEFPSLTFSYDLINKNLSTLRSKSVVLAIFAQNPAQLERRYGRDGARSLISNCNYQAILGSNDIDASKQFSEMFGSKKVLKIGESDAHSQRSFHSTTTQEVREPVILPEDFGDLPSKKQMALYFHGKYCICYKINCYTD